MGGELGLGGERAVGQVLPQVRVAGLGGVELGGVTGRVERLDPDAPAGQDGVASRATAGG
jgi:hypothetical protein